MFANTAGGILLIGIPELRAENGQATGAPDPAAPLGVTAQNPEAVLAAYDARVMRDALSCSTRFGFEQLHLVRQSVRGLHLVVHRSRRQRIVPREFLRCDE
jgi:hypothetical protein